MTQVYVFKVEAKDAAELKKVLEADPFADDSFVKTGYILKESQAVGLPAGRHMLYFKVEDAALGEKLKTRLKAVASAQQLSGEEKLKVERAVEGEQEAAAAGFGAIFGE